jgi:outer membrane protein TolC
MAISQFEKQEYIFSLEFTVKERYYNYLAQKAIVRMYTSSSIDAESSVKAMRYKFSRGEVKLEDYNGTILLLAQQQQLKIQGEGAMLIAKAKLEEVVGKKLEDIQ